MRARLIAGVLAAGAFGLAGAAHAQPGLSTKPDYDLIYKSDRIDENAQRDLNQLQNRALAALQAKDFVTAEAALAEMKQRGRMEPGALNRRPGSGSPTSSSTRPTRRGNSVRISPASMPSVTRPARMRHGSPRASPCSTRP